LPFAGFLTPAYGWLFLPTAGLLAFNDLHVPEASFSAIRNQCPHFLSWEIFFTGWKRFIRLRIIRTVQ